MNEGASPCTGRTPDSPEGGSQPLGLRTGVDTTSIARMELALSRRGRFAERTFTEAERAYCDARSRPAESYAARFAAKEATRKLLGACLGIPFTDIEVVNTNDGAPQLRLRGKAAAVASVIGARDWVVSLTHSDCCATAVVGCLTTSPMQQ